MTDLYHHDAERERRRTAGRPYAGSGLREVSLRSGDKIPYNASMDIRAVLRSNPLVLAPMAGITTFPSAGSARRWRGLVFSEMLSVEALVRSTSAPSVCSTRTLGAAGGVPDLRVQSPSMAEAASIVSQGEVDFLDINMGCPCRKS